MIETKSGVFMNSNVDLFVSALKSHFNEAHLVNDSASVLWNINGRNVQLTIQKAGLKDLIQISDREKLNRIFQIIDQLQLHVPDQLQEAPETIAINLDESTVQINGGKKFKISKLSGSGDKGTVEIQKSAAATSTQLAHTETKLVEFRTEYAGILLKIEVLETTLKALQNAHKAEKKEDEKRKDEIKEQIRELKDHLERVLEEIQKAEMAVDRHKDQLSSLKQAELVMKIFLETKNENFKDFFGIEAPTKGKAKS